MNTVHWTLAPVREEDIGVIARIHALSFDDAWSGTLIRRVLAAPGTIGLTARSDHRWAVVGFAILRIAVDECELLSIAVEPGCRGMGIGRQLLEGTFELMKESGVGKMFLEVAEDNHAARRLYTRHGLVKVGRRPGYYLRADGKKVAALTLCRDLAQVPVTHE